MGTIKPAQLVIKWITRLHSKMALVPFAFKLAPLQSYISSVVVAMILNCSQWRRESYATGDDVPQFAMALVYYIETEFMGIIALMAQSVVPLCFEAYCMEVDCSSCD